MYSVFRICPFQIEKSHSLFQNTFAKLYLEKPFQTFKTLLQNNTFAKLYFSNETQKRANEIFYEITFNISKHFYNTIVRKNHWNRHTKKIKNPLQNTKLDFSKETQKKKGANVG